MGMALFAMTLILSGRLKFLEKYFGGMDKLYRVHHRTGIISFLLLLAHPLALIASYLPVSLMYATSLLIPSDNWPLNFGLFALTGMIILIIIAVFSGSFGKIPYHILKRSHALFGMFFFVAFLHMLLIPSDISRDPLLKGYLIFLSACGLSAYTYRTLGGKYFVKKYRYTVTRVRKLNESVAEIQMKPFDDPMAYHSGQFIFIQFRDGGINKEVHPFSLSSSPHQDIVTITVKALGDYTKELPYVRVGASAYIEGPYGYFSFANARNHHQIWIAGGIGITPFLGMARSLLHKNVEKFTVDLYYCAKRQDEIIQMQELTEIAKQYPTFRVIPVCSDVDGYLTAQTIVQKSGGLTEKDIFLCGPPPMMHGLIRQLRTLGVPRSLLHHEAFQLL